MELAFIASRLSEIEPWNPERIEAVSWTCPWMAVLSAKQRCPAWQGPTPCVSVLGLMSLGANVQQMLNPQQALAVSAG